jgi:hypothetical protein
MHDDGTQPAPGSLAAYLEDPSLSPGQRSRLAIFQSVEGGVCARIEQMCEATGLEVTDVAILVVAAAAHGFVFGESGGEAATSVVLGHREKLHAFLSRTLPPTEGAPFDPYGDLLEPAPSRCVRVLVLDEESLTVMSYGTFVTVRIDPGNRAVA